MRALVLGASAGLGRHVAEALARAGHHLLLVARDERDLEALAADLRLRFGVEAGICACRVGEQDDWLEKMTASAARFGDLDALLFPIGGAREDDHGQLGLEDARRMVEVNFLGIAATVAQFLPGMLARGSGVIVGFGSVASARGRSRNVIYAAAKRALTSYFESVRHLARESGVRVQYYHLGYLDTGKITGRRLLPKADPRPVAQAIVRRATRGGGGVFYAPGYWRWVVLVVRWLPWSVFRRLRF